MRCPARSARAWNIFLSVPTLVAFLIGGYLSDLLEHQTTDQAARILFLVGAAIMAFVAVYAAWKPKSVFDNIRFGQGPPRTPPRTSSGSPGIGRSTRRC